MEALSNKVGTSKTEILAEIGAQISDLRRDYKLITKRMEVLENKNNECDNLRAEIQLLKQKADKFENSAISTELRINGIPSNQNENNFNTFNNICDVLQIPTPSTQGVFRVRNKTNSKYNDGPIIVKLSSAYERNNLMRSFAMFRRNNKSPLTLQHIGFNSTEPIYINENLTKFNNLIMRAAAKHRREGKLTAAYTLRGLVFVRMHNNDAPLHIKSLEMLEELTSAVHDFRNV